MSDSQLPEPAQGQRGDELSASSARTVAAPRVSTPSFSNISCTCFFTVDSVMPRIVAMSEFVLPWESQSSVSVARGVRPSLSSGRVEEKSGLNSRFACLLGTAQSRFDRLDKVSVGHGLRQVIIGAEVHAATQIVLIPFGCEKDEWNQAPEQRPAATLAAPRSHPTQAS